MAIINNLALSMGGGIISLKQQAKQAENTVSILIGAKMQPLPDIDIYDFLALMQIMQIVLKMKILRIRKQLRHFRYPRMRHSLWQVQE